MRNSSFAGVRLAAHLGFGLLAAGLCFQYITSSPFAFSRAIVASFGFG